MKITKTSNISDWQWILDEFVRIYESWRNKGNTFYDAESNAKRYLEEEYGIRMTQDFTSVRLRWVEYHIIDMDKFMVKKLSR